MSDVELYEPPAPTPLPMTVAPVSANELDVILRQAEILAQSNIIPSAYRKQPSNIVTAALTGRAFGWDALTAMRNGHVIEGTWSIKPEAMLALVRRAGHSVQGITGPQGAEITGKRSDTGDEMTVAFTMDDAARAGLANKGTWKQYPQAMCWARAVSQLCRMLFADVTLGLSYTPEELGAEVDAEGSPTRGLTPPANEPLTMSPENVERFMGLCEREGLTDEDIARGVSEATQGRTEAVSEVLVSEVPALNAAMQAIIDAAPEPDAA